MSVAEVLTRARAMVGQEQYPEIGEFPVERGYIWTSCASVENGNPLYWDDAVAEALTDGPIAPPTMVSVWFRPHHWAPGRTRGRACRCRCTSISRRCSVCPRPS